MATLAFGFPGIGEWLPILVILLLLFGARKLPELARSMGSSITQFKKGLKDEDPTLQSQDEDPKLQDGEGKHPGNPETRPPDRSESSTSEERRKP